MGMNPPMTASSHNSLHINYLLRDARVNKVAPLSNEEVAGAPDRARGNHVRLISDAALAGVRHSGVANILND